MNRKTKRKWIILVVLLAMSELIWAAPDFSRSVFVSQVSLRISDVTVLSPEKYEGAADAVGEAPAARYASIEPSSIIRLAEAFMYVKSKDGGLSEKVVAGCERWIAKARWEKPKEDVIGFAPEGVMVVHDTKSESLAWVLHLWEGRAVMLAGRSCGGEFYQVWPNSKEAQVDDPALVKALWAAYSDSLKKR
ncbi:MAG: hypothetical protein DVB22_001265 [Verrucomicrobia bacterium]|nr:MAG: hypothetical protein DVB22_001265 [Verrucomicrobiota bacterium]